MWVAADFKFGEKIKRAREAQRPRITRNRLAQIATAKGLTEFDYNAIESIERNQSEKKARQLIPLLVQLWGYGEDWYWDGQDSEPPQKFSTPMVRERISEYDVSGVDVDIPLHLSAKSGKVILLNKGTGKTRVPAGLAKRNEFAIRVADAEMAPRFLPGNIVIFRPQDIYDDRCYVAVENPAEMVEGPNGESRPRVYIRWYVYENGRFLLKPRSAGADTFDAASMRIVGVAIARKVEYSEEDYDLEKWERGLPFDKPRG